MVIPIKDLNTGSEGTDVALVTKAGLTINLNDVQGQFNPTSARAAFNRAARIWFRWADLLYGERLQEGRRQGALPVATGMSHSDSRDVMNTIEDCVALVAIVRSLAAAPAGATKESEDSATP
ncbi:MAG: hypothetical protein U0271_24580 [Polyangiaceae bacterium]